MNTEDMEKLLFKLSQQSAELVGDGLCEQIKGQIPANIGHHTGKDTVNIIINLRIGRLAAAAVIIFALVLSASFFGGRDSAGEGIYHEGKMLVKYCLGSDNRSRSEILGGVARFYNYLLEKGEDAVYYGDIADLEDKNALLMQWKLPEGKYRVLFANLQTKTIEAEQLVELQADMLKLKNK